MIFDFLKVFKFKKPVTMEYVSLYSKKNVLNAVIFAVNDFCIDIKKIAEYKNMKIGMTIENVS